MQIQLSQSAKEKSIERYGFELIVVVDKSISTQDHLDLNSPFFWGRNGLICLLKNQYHHILDHHSVDFYYPEAGMTAKHQAAFVSMMLSHPLSKKWKQVLILTKSPYIVSDIISDCVFIVESQPKKPLFEPNKQPQTFEQIPILAAAATKGDRMLQKYCLKDYNFLGEAYSDQSSHTAYLNLIEDGAIKSKVVTIIKQDSNFVYFYCVDDDMCREYWRADIVDFWHYFNAVYFKFTKDVTDFVLSKRTENFCTKEFEQIIKEYLTTKNQKL